MYKILYETLRVSATKKMYVGFNIFKKKNEQDNREKDAIVILYRLSHFFFN